MNVEKLSCFWATTLATPTGPLHVTRCNDYVVCFGAARGIALPAGFTADQLGEWLNGMEGCAAGFRPVSLADALNLSNDGAFVVFVFVEQPHGHVAVGMPSPAGDPDHQYVSAAGASCHVRCLLEQTFGGRVPLAYVHQEIPNG